jgi:hypothetical protein
MYNAESIPFDLQSLMTIPLIFPPSGIPNPASGSRKHEAGYMKSVSPIPACLAWLDSGRFHEMLEKQQLNMALVISHLCLSCVRLQF